MQKFALITVCSNKIQHVHVHTVHYRTPESMQIIYALQLQILRSFHSAHEVN